LHNDLNIHDAAVNLSRAIRAHAQVCSAEPNNKVAAEAAAAKISGSVTRYADAVFGKEGIVIFFDMPAEDPPGFNRAAEEKSELVLHSALGTEEFIIEDCYTIRVEDSRGLVTFADSVTNSPSQSPVDALRNLCVKDGWKVASYPLGLLEVNYHTVDAV
jgi:hypothetical protein